MIKDKRAPIILVGGIPGVGKTSISGYIASEIGVNIVLSGDYIREAIRPVLPGENILHNSVYEAWKPFGVMTEETIVKGFLEQAKIVNRSTVGIIKRAIANGEPLIIETLYFIPDQIREILDKIICFYIDIPDRTIHEYRLNERENYTHFGSPGQRLSENLDKYDLMKRESIRQCNLYKIDIFKNLNYIETRNQIINYVKQRVKGTW